MFCTAIAFRKKSDSIESGIGSKSVKTLTNREDMDMFPGWEGLSKIIEVQRPHCY